MRLPLPIATALICCVFLIGGYAGVTGFDFPKLPFISKELRSPGSNFLAGQVLSPVNNLPVGFTVTELVDALRRSGHPPSWQYQGDSQWIMRAGGVDAMTNNRVDLAIRFQFVGESATSGVAGPSVLTVDIAHSGQYLTPAEVNAVLVVYATRIRNGG